MGYDIYIGNAEIDWDLDEHDPEDGPMHIGVVVGKTTHPEAPTCPHDTMTGKSNARHPSYTGWTEFCEAVGLDDLFLGTKTGEIDRPFDRPPFNVLPGLKGRSYPKRKENGLMSRHPGCVALTSEHYVLIVTALDAYRKAHPSATPGFVGLEAHMARSAARNPGAAVVVVMDEDFSEDKETVNANLARLIWLEWWVRWALANCEHPAIYNH